MRRGLSLFTLLIFLGLVFATGVVIRDRDLTIVNGDVNVQGGTVYVGNSKVLTEASAFSSSSTSDVSVSGTYNNLNLQIMAGSVGPSELNSLGNYEMNSLRVYQLLTLDYLTTCVLGVSSGVVGCADLSGLCSSCDPNFVNTTGGDTMEAALRINTLGSDRSATSDINEVTDALYLYNPNSTADHTGILSNKTIVFWNPTSNTHTDISAGNGNFSGSVTATAYYDKDSSSYYVDPSNTGISISVAGDVIVAGRVGIGTSPPDSELHVVGGGVCVEKGDSDCVAAAGQVSAESLKSNVIYDASGSKRIEFDSSGNVIIYVG